MNKNKMQWFHKIEVEENQRKTEIEYIIQSKREDEESRCEIEKICTQKQRN